MIHDNNKHFINMIFIMFLSGILSSMYIWSDKISDIRLSLNDVYMILLMTSWMLLFMSILYSKVNFFCISLSFIILIYMLIRKQALISLKQYYKGMIPHHSMAVLMSKKILEKDKKNGDKINDADRKFIQNIINTQEKEIEYIKSRI